MSRKTVCIEREYGSNGRKIAEWLSKKTGIPLYDKKALTQIAEENHLVPENSVSEEKKSRRCTEKPLSFWLIRNPAFSWEPAQPEYSRAETKISAFL